MRSAVSLFVLVVVVFVVIILLQALFAPWGRSLTGASTLTGRWYGQITRPPGQAKLVYVKIEGLIWGADDGGCLRGCDVQGTVRVCTAPGITQDYTFNGDVSNRRASTFRINLRKVEDEAYSWRLSDMKGEWSGGDTLLLAGEWVTDRPSRQVRIVTDTAGNTVMDPPPEAERRVPATFTLHRAREEDFLSACRQLKAQ
jgi:hypothetical protein